MRLGEKVAGLVQMNDCIVLSGDLGAGKTQFAKGFAAGLGVDDDITSPTFNILVRVCRRRVAAAALRPL